MSALKKPIKDYQSLYSPSEDKKTIEMLKNKINSLLNLKPENAKKAAKILEHWLNSKQK